MRISYAGNTIFKTDFNGSENSIIATTKNIEISKYLVHKVNTYDALVEALKFSLYWHNNDNGNQMLLSLKNPDIIKNFKILEDAIALADMNDE